MGGEKQGQGRGRDTGASLTLPLSGSLRRSSRKSPFNQPNKGTQAPFPVFEGEQRVVDTTNHNGHQCDGMAVCSNYCYVALPAEAQETGADNTHA